MAIGGALTLGDVTANFRANTADFERGVKNAEMGIKNFSKNAEKGSKIIAGSFAVAGAALAAIFTQKVLKGGLDRALNIEDARAKLRGLGHETESVATIMDSALSSVEGTAFALDAAVTAAASAVAAGVKPGEDLSHVLGLTADAATIMGRDFGSAGAIVNKILASNRISAEEVNQLHDAGLPILSMLADQYGVTAGAMREMITDGVVGSKEFLEAIETNIAGAALSAGDTVRGAWANMHIAMARVGAKFWDSELPRIRDIIDGFRNFVDENADRIVDSMVKIVNKIADLGEAFVNFFNKDTETKIFMISGAIIGALVPAFIALATAVWATFAPLIPFIAIGAALGILVKLLVDRFGGWEEVSKKLSDFWDNRLAPVVRFVWGYLKDLFGVIKYLLLPQLKLIWETIKPHMPLLKMLGMVFGVIILGAILGLVTGLAFLTVAIVTGVRLFVQWVSWMVTKTQEALERVIGFFMWLYDKLVGNSIIPDIVNDIKDWFGKLPGMIMDALKGVFDAITSPFKKAFEKVKGMIPDVSEKISGLMSKAKSSSPMGAILGALPFLASGVRNFGGGLAIVGEQGPELVNLPKGSDVIPNDQIGGNVTVNMYDTQVGDMQDIRAIGRELGYRVGITP